MNQEQVYDADACERAQLLAIFDGIEEIIDVVDPRTYEVLYVNEYAKKLYGNPRIGGSCYKEFYGLEAPCDFCNNGALLIHKDKFSKREVHHPVLKRDFIVTNRIIRWPDGRDAKLTTFLDIKERKEAEEALKRSEERYRAVVDNIAVGISVLNSNMEIVEVNRALKRYFPHVRPGCGQICYEQYNDPPRSEPCSYCPCVLTLQDGKLHESITETPAGSEIRHYHLVSSPIKDSEGRVQYVIELTEDITDRKKAEEALLDSEERLRAVVYGCPMPQFVIDRDLRVIFWNKALEEISGIRAEEVVGTKHHWKAFYTNERPCLADLLVRGDLEGIADWYGGKCRKSKFSADVYEITDFVPHLGRDGKWLYFTAAVIRDSKGNVVGAVETLEDITDRKKAEEALGNSEATLRTLLQAAPVGIGQISADRTLGWTNDLLCNMVGYSREELAGKSARILYESDEEFLRVWGEKHPEGIRYGTGSVETCFRRKDGSAFHVLLSTSSVVGGHLSQGMVFTAMDITERKRAEEQIRLNDERLQILYDISQYKAESIQDLRDFTLNQAVKLSESNLGYVCLYDEDKEVFEFTNWSKGAMRECEVAEPPTYFELDKTGIWGEAVRQRKPIVLNDFQAPNALKKGYPKGHADLRNFMTIPVFEGNKIVAVVGVANKDSDYDESDVRQLTLLMDSVWRIAAAKRSELVQRRSATALEHAAEGVLITDTDGIIQYVNPSLERMTGYSQDQLLGNNPRILKSGEQDAAFYEELWGKIKSGNIWTGRFINKRKDGTFYTEDATISPVRDASGTITGFVGIKRDITEQLALSRQLAHAQKMEAVGTLAGGMAHDFNNILQAILGCSDLMLMKTPAKYPERKKLEVIQQAARDGADLVSRILTFSRKADLKRRPVDLNQEIRKAQRLIRRTIPRMIEIRLVLAKNLSIIDADPGQVVQILLNLAVNAHHAMPNGGQLLIETSNVSPGDEFLLTHLGAKAGRYVLLSVSDTGKGMEAEVLDRIFEPFFTTKTNGEGTGLGLSMVHGIVSQHGGYIRCDSGPGKGTSFKIYLPVSERVLDSGLDLTREMPAFGTETILLVDDDDGIRETGKEMIEMFGYTVLVAKSGEEALDIYSSHGEEIALVILDLIMPGMGGSRCLRELIRIDPDVRVLVASGHSSNDLAIDQESSGARGFVSKPYDVKEILTAVRRVIDTRDS